MKNFDEEFNKYPHSLILKMLFLPKIYLADSISDFIQNHNDIRVTKRPTLYGLLYYNCALVIMPKCTFEKYEPDYFELVGKITDNKGDYLDVIYNQKRGLSIDKHYEIEDKMILYEPWILYDKKTKQVWLHHFKSYGPESFESEKEKNNISLKLCPSFI